MDTVEFRPWPGDERYRVGSDGAVIGPAGRPVGSLSGEGYRVVSMRGRDGRRTSTTAHVMVCETFHGPRPPGAQAAHGDGDPSNNAADNLSWKTPKGNAADRVRHGTNGHKLDAETVLAVRAVDRRIPSPRVADEAGVTPGMVRHIRRGHSWSGLPSSAPGLS